MDAVNPIDQLNEVKRLQQALRENPKDLESQLKLATFVKDRETKRKLLNVILSLDPTNKTARDILLELDRVQRGANHAQTISTGQVPTSPSVGTKNNRLEKILVFRYSIFPQLVVYVLIAFTIYLCFEALRDSQALMVFTAFLLFLGIPLWFVSVVVRVNDSGIKVSRLFGVVHWETSWDEIEIVKSNLIGQGMNIITKEGRSAKISSQVRGYLAIVEILRKIRPDLFEIPASDPVYQGNPSSFAEMKTFQRSSFIKYGSFLLATLACLISVGILIAQPFVGILIVGLVAFLLFNQLNSPHTVMVQGNKLSTKSTLKQEEWTAERIKDIQMGYTRSRYGFKRNFIRVETAEGRMFRLAGFAEGDEILYGFLKNWWSSCRNK